MIKWIYPTLIDNDDAITTKKDVSDDMKAYVELLIKSIEESNRQTQYKLSRDTTEVSQIVLYAVKKETLSESLEKKCQSVADRFLQYEFAAKEKIEKLHKTIQNGCLIQALVKISDKQFKYVIAKGDWSEFLNKDTFSMTEGIHINKKNLGKSCIFYISIDSNNDASITDCKVLLDNPATYFWSEFLELEKCISDDDSTKNLVKKVTKAIDDSFKKDYPRDRQYLRNTFVTYLRSNDLIDYELIKQTIFIPYLENSDIDKSVQDSFLEKYDKLPESGKNKFGRQFTCIKEKIEANLIKSKYVLDRHIFLEIQDDYDETELSKITSGRDYDQQGFIKIYTDNEEALKTFCHDDSGVE